MSIETLGWIGALCFSLCGLPQLVLTVKNGNANGVSTGFLGLWITGEVCMGTFMLLTGAMKPQLAINYIVNIVGIMLILKYKIFPRSSSLDNLKKESK